MNAREAYEEICAHLDYETDDFMFDGRFEYFNEIVETSFTVLDLFKNALTLEHTSSYAPISTKHNEDGSIDVNFKTSYNIIRNGLEEEIKKELTKWIIENIDKEKVKEWLND